MKGSQYGGILLYTVLALLLASTIGMGLANVILPNMTVGLDSARIHQADYAMQSVRNIIRGEAGQDGQRFWSALISLAGKKISLHNTLSVTIDNISVSWNHIGDDNTIYRSEKFSPPLLNDGDTILVQDSNTYRLMQYSSDKNNTVSSNRDSDLEKYTESSFQPGQNIFFVSANAGGISLSNNSPIFSKLPQKYGLLRLIDKNNDNKTHSIIYKDRDNLSSSSSSDVLLSSSLPSDTLNDNNSILMIDKHADITVSILFADGSNATRIIRLNSPTAFDHTNSTGSPLIFDFFKEIMDLGRQDNASLKKILQSNGSKSVAHSEEYGESKSAAKLLADNLIKHNPTGDFATKIFRKFMWRFEYSGVYKKDGYYDLFLAECNSSDIDQLKNQPPNTNKQIYLRVWRLRYYEGENDKTIIKSESSDQYNCIIEPVWVKIENKRSKKDKQDYYILDTDNGNMITRKDESTILHFNQNDNNDEIIYYSENILYNKLSNTDGIIDSYYTHSNCPNKCYPYSKDMYDNVSEQIFNRLQTDEGPLQGTILDPKYDNLAAYIYTNTEKNNNRQTQRRLYLASTDCRIPSAPYISNDNPNNPNQQNYTRYVQGTWYISSIDQELDCTEPRDPLNTNNNYHYSILKKGSINESNSIEPNAWVEIDYDKNGNKITDTVKNLDWTEYLSYP